MFNQKSQFFLVDSTRPSFQKDIRIKNGSTEFDQKQKAETDEQPQINLGIYRRFEQFLNNQKLFKLHNAFKKHYGRHYPISYKPEFGFTQYWQDKKSKIQESKILQYFQYPQWYYYLFTFSILISKLGIIWFISVHRLFQMSSQNMLSILMWGLITVILDIVLQYELFTHYDYLKDNKMIKCAKSFWKDIILILYFVTLPAYHSDYDSILLLIDFVIVLLMTKRVEQIRRCFHLQITSTSYKNSYKLGELFATILPIAHVFALVLYFVAQQNADKNWLTVHQLQYFNPTDKYIYSLYFAFTTMLTVGYGDIAPVNIPQIIVIMAIQIIGIITYGYIVNQIGHIISHIRKQDEILSKDIATISKMAKYYDLDKNLVQKAKNFLVFQKKQRATLTPEEEQTTLRKLHDDLRQQISQQNCLKIVKSSLFYVCNWTKRFQVQIAKKLHKKIFTPNEQILQMPGKQRIYVFKKGKVEIHANRASGYKRHFKKILRTIEPNETMEVSDNIYGYSFLMSNAPIKLTAINKEFVVAYFVEKKDFLETVQDSHLDCEYYFEMKTKIDSMTYPDSWQAPLIINTKEHYFPNIQYLIMKNRHMYQKQKNIRSTKIDLRRYRNRSKRVFYRNFEQMEGQYTPAVEINDPYGNFQTPILDIKTLPSEKVIPTSITLENNNPQSARVSNSNLNDLSTFRKENLHYLLEQGRQYNFFFKRSNRSQVLYKMQNSNYMTKSKKFWKPTKLFKKKMNQNMKYQTFQFS